MNKQINPKQQILELGRELMTLNDTDETLALISKEAKSLINTQRCSIFVVDQDTHTLWTKLSDGLEMITISLDSGIVGETYKTQKPQITNSPYDNPKFMKNIDETKNFKTKNIISIPIFNSKKDVIAIIELLNKIDSDFNDKDVEVLTFFANFVSPSLELCFMDDWLELPQI